MQKWFLVLLLRSYKIFLIATNIKSIKLYERVSVFLP